MGFFSKLRNKKKDKAAPPVVGYFGKHPSAGDFLRHNASSPEVLALDEWLSLALAAGPKVLGAWEQSFISGPTLRFLCHQGAGRCLLGALAPSQDRSGRLFPLITFAELDSALVTPSYVSIPHEAFLHRCRELLECRSSLPWDRLQGAAVALAPPDETSLLKARQGHERYMDSTTLGAALDGMFDADQDQAARALTAASLVAESVGPDSVPPYGLRCPLGGAPANAGTWLALLGRPLPDLLPCLIWSDEALLFYYGGMPAKALAAALDPQWQDDSICDLTTTTTEAGGAAPPRETTLRSFLEQE
jgi:type VI secretion system ImpM family protein